MKEGIYVMAMCINGIWQEVVLDDFFPCQPYSKKPIFNSTKTDELWVMFLEKAWAKVHGGYMNINAGLTREALRDLTGGCAKTFFTQSLTENE
jgi:calpain-15